MMTTPRQDKHEHAPVHVSPERAAQLATSQITLAEFAGLTRQQLYEIANVAYRLLNSGKLTEARDVYRGLVAADPLDSVFHCHLAATHLRLGDVEEAIKEFTSALRYNIANADALAGRGEAYLNRGQLAEAIKDLRAAVELDPEAKRASTLRARAILLALRKAAQEKNPAS